MVVSVLSSNGDDDNGGGGAGLCIFGGGGNVMGVVGVSMVADGGGWSYG